MDVVYMVKAGERNEELRYSLRSVAANLPHGRVWIVGHRPTWLTGVEHLRVRQGDQKHDNTWSILRAAANCPDISDEFVLMNDDFFVMQPLDRVPMLHRGPLTGWLERHGARRGSWAAEKMQATADVLTAVGRDPSALLSYELHVPMAMDRRWLAEAVAVVDLMRTSGRVKGPLCKRTLYGNYAQVGGVAADDCKIANEDLAPDPARLFLSTSDGSFRYWKVGRYIRARLTAPSPYENGQSDGVRRLARSRPLRMT